MILKIKKQDTSVGLEKEPNEGGEAGPGGLIKPFLNSHSHKLCPRRLSSLIPQKNCSQGLTEEAGRNRQVTPDGAGTGWAQPQAQPRAQDFMLGTHGRITEKGQSLGLKLAKSGFAPWL